MSDGLWATGRHRPPGDWIQASGLVHVAGLQFRGPDTDAFCKAARKSEAAGLEYGLDLERDPENEADRNAIRVIGRAVVKRFLRAPELRHWHIGFVPRELAAEITADVLEHGEDCAFLLHGIGRDHGHPRIAFRLLVRKGSAAARRRLERRAGRGAADNLTEEQRHLLRDGQMGLYRNTRLTEAEALKKLGRFDEALERYLRVSWLDQSGPTNLGGAFRPEDRCIAPGITKAIAGAANTLGIDLEEVGRRFIAAGTREVEAFAPIAPAVAHVEAWETMMPLVAEAMASGTKWRRPKTQV